MSVEQEEELLILGVTIDGDLFHQRDWAERLCGILASYNNGRLVYSEFVHPVMREGHPYMSVVVQPELKNVNPQVYEFIMSFVRDNRLKMTMGRKVARQQEELLILGVTMDGDLFHPRDWAERLCGILASYNYGRLVYSEFVHPVMREGHPYMSVVVETELKNVNPQVYEFIMGFVRDNKLKMTMGRKAVPQRDIAVAEALNYYRRSPVGSEMASRP
jgi:uncharacterized protein DUF3579